MVAALLCLAEPLFVRSSQVSIVPPEPLALGGYTARKDALFEPGGDDLFARSVVFSQGKTQVALVSVEMLTVPESLAEKVRGLVPKDVQLMMVATHTHCAPDSQMLNNRMTFRIPGISVYSRKWEAWYAEKIAASVNTALTSSAVPAESESTWSKVVEGNRGRRAAAEPDKVSRNLSLGGVRLLNYSAHATLHDESFLKLSGDWPGEAMKTKGVVVLPAAIGDVSPVSEGEDAAQQCRHLANALLSQEGVERSTLEHPEMSFARVPIELGQPTPHPEFAKSNGINDGLAKLLVGRFSPASAELTGLVIGRTLIVGVPGEPTSELGRRIQAAGKAAGFDDTWVVSHCNGWVGYILMPEDYDRGGYEASLAMHGRDLALRVIDSAQKLANLLKAMASPNRKEALAGN